MSFVTSVHNMRKLCHLATGKSEPGQPVSWVGARCWWDCTAGLGNSSYFLAIAERLSDHLRELEMISSLWAAPPAGQRRWWPCRCYLSCFLNVFPAHQDLIHEASLVLVSHDRGAGGDRGVNLYRHRPLVLLRLNFLGPHGWHRANLRSCSMCRGAPRHPVLGSGLRCITGSFLS